MTRAKSGLSPTPFATVIVDYMASKRPVWTTGRLARELKLRRTTIANWVHHDVTPPLDKMLAVLAQLDIPISALLDAYRDAGLPTPALDYEDTRSGAASGAKARGVRDTRDMRDTRDTRDARARATEITRAEAEEERWSKRLETTREVMLATGFPAAALDSLLATIESSRAGDHPFAQRIAQEYEEGEEQEEGKEGEEYEGDERAGAPNRLRSKPAPGTTRSPTRSPRRATGAGDESNESNDSNQRDDSDARGVHKR